MNSSSNTYNLDRKFDLTVDSPWLSRKSNTELSEGSSKVRIDGSPNNRPIFKINPLFTESEEDASLAKFSTTWNNKENIYGICTDRTPAVKNAIFKALNAQTWNDVSPELLKTINYLNLSSQDIDAISPNDLQGLTELKTLHLNNNRLKSIPADLFEETPNLRILRLDHNEINELDSDVFTDVPELFILDLSHNNLSEISEELLQPLILLTVLNLSHNNLKDINPDCLDNLVSLAKLYLNHNQLETIPKRLLTNLWNLNYLGLEHNQLGTIDIKSFESLGDLIEIDLSYNNLTECQDRLFYKNIFLEKIDLSHNKLTETPRFYVKRLKNLSEIHLVGNPIARPDTSTKGKKYKPLKSVKSGSLLGNSPLPDTRL